MVDNKGNSIQIYKQLMRFFLQREIVNFYEFLNILDENLNTRRQEIDVNIGLAKSNFDGLEKNDEYRKEIINLKVESEQVRGFTNLLRQTFITSLYSFMELWLVRKCHDDSLRRDGGYSFHNTKGKGLEKVKKYFSGVMSNNYPFGTSEDWLWLTNFQLLRDCIIHRQGSLTGFSNFEINPTLSKFVDNENGLNKSGIDNNQIFIEYDFCLKSLQTVNRFMLELLDLKEKDDNTSQDRGIKA